MAQENPPRKPGRETPRARRELALATAGSTASADISELTIERLIFPVYHPTHLVFFRPAFAHDIVPGCQIVHLDLGLVGASNIVLGWLPMTDWSLHIARAGSVWGLILCFRRKRNGGRRREHDHCGENRTHSHAPRSIERSILPGTIAFPLWRDCCGFG